jgi:predicted nuclease with TOPRIM domain
LNFLENCNNDFGDSLNTDADKLTINFKNDKNFQFSSLPANVDTLNSSILSNSVYLTPKPTSRRLNEYNNLNQNHIDYIFNSEKLKRPFFNENSNLTDLDQNKRTKQCYYDTRIDNLLFKLSNLENNVNRLTEDNKFLRQEVKEVKELNAQLMDNVDVLKKRIEVIDKDTTENHIEMNIMIYQRIQVKYYS